MQKKLKNSLALGILITITCFAGKKNDNITIAHKDASNIHITIHTQEQEISQSTVTQTMQSTHHQTTSPSPFSLEKKLQELLQNIDGKNIPTTTYAWLTTHKLYLAGATALSIYGCIFYNLFKARRYGENPSRWSAWKQNLSLAQLLACPQKELENELILEIQRRYTVPSNPTDFIIPLATFVEEINKEIVAITYYQTLFTWVKKCHLKKLFPTTIDYFENINQLLERALYCKNLFLSWAAAYKLEHRVTTSNP